MIVLGIILVILGWLLGVGLLTTIGLILVAIGVILMLLGALDRGIGPRRYYW